MTRARGTHRLQAREVFEAAEARCVADLCGDIWARVHTLESLALSINADAAADGAASPWLQDASDVEPPLLVLPPVRGAGGALEHCQHHPPVSRLDDDQPGARGADKTQLPALSLGAAAVAGSSELARMMKPASAAAAQKYPVTEVPGALRACC